MQIRLSIPSRKLPLFWYLLPILPSVAWTTVRKSYFLYTLEKRTDSF